MSYLTLSEFRDLSIMPGEDVDSLDARAPGWIAKQLESESAAIDARLSKRYATPFSAPYPVMVRRWLAQLVTLRAFLRRGVDPSDAQFQEILADSQRAKDEIKEAADSKDGLFDLPLRADTNRSGIVVEQTLGYSEQDPYTWTDRQSEAFRGR